MSLFWKYEYSLTIHYTVGSWIAHHCYSHPDVQWRVRAWSVLSRDRTPFRYYCIYRLDITMGRLAFANTIHYHPEPWITIFIAQSQHWDNPFPCLHYPIASIFQYNHAPVPGLLLVLGRTSPLTNPFQFQHSIMSLYRLGPTGSQPCIWAYI